jgi:hypothetical protein
MEGHGVTNYATDKPSYAFSTATTEFDDALIQRGIITHTQAMGAKGASVEESVRLAAALVEESVRLAAALSSTTGTTTGTTTTTRLQPPQPPPPLDENDATSSDDDDFMTRYRHERLLQFRQAHEERLQGRRFGQALHISRTEWAREVNQASHHVWVVVCLTSSDTERTGCIQAAVQLLATQKDTIKFVIIPYQAAISPTWPLENLPTLFFYRHGALQQQFVQLPWDLDADALLDLVASGTGGSSNGRNYNNNN